MVCIGCMTPDEAREVIGKPVEMQHAPESADRITRAIRQQLNDDGFSRTEVLCLRKDGSKFWASLAVRPQDAHDRQGRYTIAVYREIDELKSREAAAAAALQERDRVVAVPEDLRTMDEAAKCDWCEQAANGTWKDGQDGEGTP